MLGRFDEQQLHFDNQLKTKELERQLEAARRAQQAALCEQEAAKATGLEQHNLILLTQEIELRKQLELYAGKFDSFQAALQSSNDAFKTHRSNLEELSKQRNKLERENAAFRARAEASDARAEKEKGKNSCMEKELVTLRHQKVRLEKLCRGLSERRAENLAIAPADMALPAPDFESAAVAELDE